MKYKLLIIALLFTLTSYCQIDAEYETETFEYVNAEPYLKALNQMIRLDTLVSDEVLVTLIKSNSEKNKYFTRQALRTYLLKHYYSAKEKRFHFLSDANYGYILVFGQYGKDPDIAIRFWTLFIDQTTGKISVIEIEENK